MVKFGTGGWRAVIADGFTRDNVSQLARAICRKMKSEGVADKGVCIGYDRRFLSAEATYWAAEVFAFEKVPCRIIDKAAPTPLIMFTVKKMELPYGLALTASHNPAIYNGVKVFTAGGRDADETVTDVLESYINELANEPVGRVDYEKALQSGAVTIINPINEYIDSIIGFLDMGAIRNRGLKVALDPMYGVSQTSLQTILMTARCDVDVIHDRHDTLFGGKLPTPNIDTLKSLTSFVVDHRRDIGIATDGDADRLGVINEKGRFLHPNDILVLLYYYLVKYKGWSGPAVRNIATTHLLDKVAESFGQKCYEVPVGFKHVSSKMQEVDAVIGGESSGGLTVRGHISGKDGIYAAALLCEMMAVTNKNLATILEDITNEFGDHQMAECDYSFSVEKKWELMRTIFEEKKLPDFPHEIEKVSYLDGCKVYFKNGWIIVRFSGTEPLLRIFCEMSDINEARKCCEMVRDFLGL